jgi:hypothetical protein
MWFISRRPEKRSRDHARARRFAPRLEALETRALPSTLTVFNALDSGAGSLRDAVTNAKSGDTIVFAPSLDGQTISLTSDALTIKKNLDIEGPGADKLAVSGNDTLRIFNIDEGCTVTIAGLTIAHGLGAISGSEGGGGGGILNGGSLSIENDVFSANLGQGHGGAISNLTGAVVTVTNSAFIGNQAVATDPRQIAEGGGLWNSDRGSTATIIGCSFLENEAIGANGGVVNDSGNGQTIIGEAAGGALHNEGFTGAPSTLTVENSTFIGNEAIAGNGGTGGKSAKVYIVDIADGGAIVNHDGGNLAVSGCTFSYNEAIGGSNATASSSGSGRIGHALGGALENEGTLAVTNSEFDHNEALGGSNNTGGAGVSIIGRGAGGAINNFEFTTPATLSVSNSNFTDNRALGGTGNTGGTIVSTGVGGGVNNERGGLATVSNSTFTGNQAIGGAGEAGGDGADGLGGGIANALGATLTVSGCTLIRNQALGGAGGSGANGGNGFGGGLYNDGASSLTVTLSSVTNNSATGGAAGSGGSAGQGVGGGAYFATGGVVCLDLFTSMNITGNTASTNNNDIFGNFTIC